MQLQIRTAEELDREEWVTFDREGYEDTAAPVEFKIVPLGRTARAAIQNHARKNGVSKKVLELFESQGAMFSARGSDAAKLIVEVIDYLVRDWRNVTSMSSDEPLPCTRETKAALAEDMTVVLWIVSKATEIVSKARSEDTGN